MRGQSLAIAHRFKLIVGIGAIAVFTIVVYLYNLSEYTISELRIYGGCELPCWQGIHPGQTSSEEAWTIISRSPWAAQSPISSGDGTRAQIIGYRFYGRNVINIHLENNKVSHITLVPSDSTLQDILNEFGSPLYIVVVSAPFAGEVGSQRYNAHLLYPDRGIHIKLDTFPTRTRVSDHGIVEIEPDLEIGIVEYFPPLNTMDGEQAIEKWLVPYDYYGLALSQSQAQDWSGYGEYRITTKKNED